MRYASGIAYCEFSSASGVAARSQLLDRRLHAPHRRIESPAHACIFHIEQHLVAVLRRECLHHLNAAPVPVHVAEAAGIHQDVEAELLPGAEAAQHFVVLAAMAQAQVDDLAPASLARHLHAPAEPVGKNGDNARKAK